MEIINKKSLIPILRNSKLAEQFGNIITVPKKYVFTDYEAKITINDETSFRRVMDQLRYYMVEELPEEVFDYVFDNQVDLSEFKDFFFDELSTVMSECKGKAFIECFISGNLKLVKYFHKKNVAFNMNVCSTYVTVYNHLDILKFLVSVGFKGSHNVSTAALEYGHVDILKYLIEKNLLVLEYKPDPSFGTVFVDQDVYASACRLPSKKELCGNKLECLKFLHGYYKRSFGPILCCKIGYDGDFECMKYLHENGLPMTAQRSNYASGSNLEYLKYLHKNNCSFNDWTCSSAAFEGRLDCLKYLHVNGIQWNSRTCQHAAMTGHYNCLKYGHENGLALTECMEALSVGCSVQNSSGYPHSQEPSDHAKCFEYLLDNNCPGSKEQLKKIRSALSIT